MCEKEKACERERMKQLSRRGEEKAPVKEIWRRGAVEEERMTERKREDSGCYSGW